MVTSGSGTGLALRQATAAPPAILSPVCAPHAQHPCRNARKKKRGEGMTLNNCGTAAYRHLHSELNRENSVLAEVLTHVVPSHKSFTNRRHTGIQQFSMIAARAAYQLASHIHSTPPSHFRQAVVDRARAVSMGWIGYGDRLRRLCAPAWCSIASP